MKNYFNNDDATYLLMKEANRLKVGIKEVVVSKITEFSVPDNVSKGKNWIKHVSR